MLLNDSHVQGIFKYSDDIEFERGDFVVEGNCIYICTAESVKRKRPSKNPDYYTAYPGDKITTAQEYYNYLDTRENGEDKYVSAYALCDILENMYFGFGDNGLITDHVIYNPAEGIEYSIKGVKEILNNTTPDILNQILQTEDLNNGLVKISRNLREISDILQESYNDTFESDVVILRQYTYLDSTKDTKFRVQELIDPEKNKMYFRFSKGETIDETTYFNSASPWKNIYSDDEEIRNKLNTIEDYYRSKVLEVQDLYNRLQGKYCYRNVEFNANNHPYDYTVSLRPGGSKDIKSIESFTTKSCFLDIIIKSPVEEAENLYKNYSITIDTKDIVEGFNSTENYQVGDGIVLEGMYSSNIGGYQTIILTVPQTCIIKDIYYRDYTLGHIHEWILVTTNINPTCTSDGWGVYECDFCDETKEDIIPRLNHDMTKVEGQSATCTEDGWKEHFICANEPGVYYKDEYGNSQYTGWDEGDDPVVIHHEGIEHNWRDWRITSQASCTTNGIRERRCFNCNEVQTEVIPALGHDMVETSRQEPTCGEEGHIYYQECRRCHILYDENQNQITINDIRLLPTGNHNIPIIQDVTDLLIVEQPTYTDDPNPHKGKGLIRCSDCNHYIEVELDYKQHDIDPQTSARYERLEPTCTEDGYEQGVCSCHGIIRKNILPALGHVVEHEPGNINYINPDCSTNTPGLWKGTCTRCGETDAFEYNLEDPPKHEVNTNDPHTHYIENNCINSAYWEGTCTICHQDHINVEDDNHKPVGHVDRDENHSCDVCGATIPSEEQIHNL